MMMGMIEKRGRNAIVLEVVMKRFKSSATCEKRDLDDVVSLGGEGFCVGWFERYCSMGLGASEVNDIRNDKVFFSPGVRTFSRN